MCVWQDWALGVLHAKIAVAACMMGPNGQLKQVLEQVTAVVTCYCCLVHVVTLFFS